MVKHHTTTELLKLLRAGEPGAANRLYEHVQDELRRVAHNKMAKERQGHTLQTTALVNETYLKLQSGGAQDWENSKHFFAAAANAMRQILVDQARKKGAQKRIEKGERVSLDPAMVFEEPDASVIDVDQAIDLLAVAHPLAARIVSYRVFLDLDRGTMAQLLDVSPSTIDNHWKFAKTWLKRELSS